MCLIRNHAEAVVKEKGVTNLVNMLGFNYRMTEIEAAIASEQLKKLERLLLPRIEAAEYLTGRLCNVPGLTPPRVRPGVKHGYYDYVLRYDEMITGVPRSMFAKALQAEGMPVAEGYVEPLYLQPLYQQRILFGKQGHPFTSPAYCGTVSYHKGICPVTERMHSSEVLTTDICHAGVTRSDLDDFVTAVLKVADHLDQLRCQEKVA